MHSPSSRTWPRPLFIVAMATALSLTAGAPRPAPLPDLNEKVIAFARASLGQPVGDGSCTTLAIEALRQAGAQLYPIAEPDGDFTWGQPIASFKEALPGDILQFRNAVFRGRRSLSHQRWMTWREEYLHHTAIVSRVSETGKLVEILHQNVIMQGQEGKDAKNVRQGTLRLDSLQKGGYVRIYRPVPASTHRQRPEPIPEPEPEPETERDGE